MYSVECHIFNKMAIKVQNWTINSNPLQEVQFSSIVVLKLSNDSINVRLFAEINPGSIIPLMKPGQIEEMYKTSGDIPILIGIVEKSLINNISKGDFIMFTYEHIFIE